MFQKRKWSLSLPIVPPTVDKVAAMLKGTKRNPAESPFGSCLPARAC